MWGGEAVSQPQSTKAYGLHEDAVGDQRFVKIKPLEIDTRRMKGSRTQRNDSVGRCVRLSPRLLGSAISLILWYSKCACNKMDELLLTRNVPKDEEGGTGRVVVSLRSGTQACLGNPELKSLIRMRCLHS